MKITETSLPGVLILEPKRIDDMRGSFCEIYNAETMASNGIEIQFVQDNHSISFQIGTLRGLHFQAPPLAQDKLVRVGAGRIYDVAVDIRKGSPFYGAWFGIELSEQNGKQLLIPKGFLHGFVTREPNSQVLYKCSNLFSPQFDSAVRFDDTILGIDWGIPPETAIVSEKDQSAQKFSTFDSPFTFEG